MILINQFILNPSSRSTKANEIKQKIHNWSEFPLSLLFLNHFISNQTFLCLPALSACQMNPWEDEFDILFYPSHSLRRNFLQGNEKFITPWRFHLGNYKMKIVCPPYTVERAFEKTLHFRCNMLFLWYAKWNSLAGHTERFCDRNTYKHATDSVSLGVSSSSWGVSPVRFLHTL